MKKNSKIFVTGAAGFIGQRLIQLLLREGYAVQGLYHSQIPQVINHFPMGKKINQDQLKFVQGDITDIESLRIAMNGCSHVFHLAGYAKNWSSDRKTYDVINHLGMRNVFQVAKELHVERVVWTSSIVTFGPTLEGEIGDETIERHTQSYFTDYERSKSVAEQEALQWASNGFPVVIVNPTRVFGPGPFTDGNAIGRLIYDCDHDGFFVMLNFGMNFGNYVYVDDVAHGHYLAMLYGRIGERYILGGENASLFRLTQMIQKVTGKKQYYPPLFKTGAVFYSHLFVLWAKLTGMHPMISPDWVRTFLAEWCYSSDKAKKELGYKPIPIFEGIKRTHNWFQEKEAEATCSSSAKLQIQ